MLLPIDVLRRRSAAHPYPLIFATISGAHLYGFPSPDSDFDLRGAHVLPLREVVGLTVERETVVIGDGPGQGANQEISVPGETANREIGDPGDGLEFDIVSHDVRKFFGLMLKKNGYVLEQVFSPLVVKTGAAHEELKAIAKGCITRHHGHHYLGFTETQWKLFCKAPPTARRVKPLLYVYRVLLTGIHLMRTGEVEANILRLNEEFKLGQIGELVERKVKGAERGVLPEGEWEVHAREKERLEGILREEMERSRLPEAPSAREALNDLLVRVRMGEAGG